MGASHPKGLSTRLLTLLEIHNRRHAKLQPLADRLGVTVQAVSVVLKRLKREGLVENRGGEWRPTPRGTDTLHGAMRDLRRFVDDAIGTLRLIDETLAQADAPIRAGQEVGLFMREGRLRAAPRVYAGSQGRARTNARRGDLVRIVELHGILALQPGTITLVAHPPQPTAHQERRARGLLAKAGRNGHSHKLGAHDLTSAVLLEHLGRRPDFEFAALSAAVDAARRGVSVQYWVPAADLPDCLASVSQTNGSTPNPVTVRSVEL